jgi:DNA-binding GntR family transcriptional regulator
VAQGLSGERLVRRSSGEDAARHIQRLIFDGELRPGTRVPQDDIAQALGISRIPVREALIALEREGWVTIEMHRGAFVNAIDAEGVRDHYSLLGLVYGFAATRALARGGTDLVATLEAIARQVEEAGDPRRLSELSIRFLATMVEGAHSPRVKVVLRAMSALVPGEFFVEVPAAVDVQKRGIAAVARALRRGDGDRVAAELLRMMHRVGEKVVDVFESRGLFEVGPE